MPLLFLTDLLPPPDDIDGLIRRLEDEEWEVRDEAHTRLPRSGRRSPERLESLHLPASAKRIQRTLLQEPVSLLGSAGTEPCAALRLAEGVRLDLPAQSTQVIPMGPAVLPHFFDPAQGPLADAEPACMDSWTGAAVKLVARAIASRRASVAREGPSDPAILKNLTIARLATGFRAARLAEAGGACRARPTGSATPMSRGCFGSSAKHCRRSSERQALRPAPPHSKMLAWKQPRSRPPARSSTSPRSNATRSGWRSG